MVNQQLRRVILLNLERIEFGLTEESLKCAVTVETGWLRLTTNEFMTELRELERRGLVRKWENLNGEMVYGIEDMGRDALRGL